MDRPEHRAQSLEDEADAQTLTRQRYTDLVGKQREKHPLEDNPFIEDFLGWMDSSEGQQSIEALDIVWPLLENAGVDAKRRKIIWEDGQRLSITQSAQRIHADYPDLPPDLIEAKVISWLESGFAPESYSPQQLDELDRLTEKWIEDHQAAGKKRPRTPDS
ncbi:MAG: hypothetical protein ACREV7_05695 [Steroidobacteraceae bacterium]